MLRRILPLALLGLLVGVGSLLAAEAAVTIKALDVDKGTIVVTGKSKAYTLTIAKDVKVVGADGKPLADGMKSKELKEGIGATINYERTSSGDVLRKSAWARANARR